MTGYEYLSARERLVVALVALGFTAAESARCLGSTNRSVEESRDAARGELGASTLPHLVSLVYERRLRGVPLLSETEFTTLSDQIREALGREPSPDFSLVGRSKASHA